MFHTISMISHAWLSIFMNVKHPFQCFDYSLYTKWMLPLLPRCVLGMPLILLVSVVRIWVMSQNPKTPILGLTKTNYNAPRMSNEIWNKSQVLLYRIHKSNCNMENLIAPFKPDLISYLELLFLISGLLPSWLHLDTNKFIGSFLCLFPQVYP